MHCLSPDAILNSRNKSIEESSKFALTIIAHRELLSMSFGAAQSQHVLYACISVTLWSTVRYNCGGI